MPVLLVKLTGCRIHGDTDLLSRTVPCFFHRFHKQLQRFLRILQIRSKAALVSHSRGKSPFFEDFFQHMIGLRTHLQSFPKTARSHRHDHKFLKINGIVRMTSAVQNIHHRHRQPSRSASSQILIQRYAKCFRRCPRHGKGYTQNRVGSHVFLIRRSIRLPQQMIDLRLIQRIFSDNHIRQHGIDILHSLLDTHTAVAFLPVSQFHRFEFSCGSSGRHHRTPCISF